MHIISKILFNSKVVGLEPTTLILETKVLPIKLYLYTTWCGNRTRVYGLKIRCTTTMLTRLEMVGLEPTSFICKTNVLPVILHPNLINTYINIILKNLTIYLLYIYLPKKFSSPSKTILPLNLLIVLINVNYVLLTAPLLYYLPILFLDYKNIPL